MVLKICVGDVDLTSFHQHSFTSHFKRETVTACLIELLIYVAHPLGTVEFSKKKKKFCPICGMLLLDMCEVTVLQRSSM